MSAENLFTDITGCDYNDKISLLTLRDSFKMKPHLVDRPGMESRYHFETAWEKSKLEAQEAEKVREQLGNAALVDPPQA